MIRKTLLSVPVVLVAAWQTATIAQEPGSRRVAPTLINDITTGFETEQEQRRARDRAEDAAVLSAILREDLVKLYGSDPHAGLAAAAGGERENINVGRPLAEYLPGYGVIVQVEAPAPRRPPTSSNDPETEGTPLTRWEATQRRLRGEASAMIHGGKGCITCHDVEANTTFDLVWPFGSADGMQQFFHPAAGPAADEITAALVEVLANNGRHLRHLQPDERVTLSLHYRAAAADRSEQRGGKSSLTPTNAAPGEESELRAAKQLETASSTIDLLIRKKLDWAAPSSRDAAGRISVTAAKRHLDAVAEGALTQEEFQKHLRIQVFSP